MKTYKDEIFCHSDCINMECFRYLDAGVEADARKVGQPIASSDFSRTCPYYLQPKKKGKSND